MACNVTEKNKHQTHVTKAAVCFAEFRLSTVAIFFSLLSNCRHCYSVEHTFILRRGMHFLLKLCPFWRPKKKSYVKYFLIKII